MSDYAIEVNNLGKQYRIGESPSVGKKFQAGLRKLPLGQSLFRKLFSRITPTRFLSNEQTSIADNNSNTDDEFWALKNVSFKIKPGEVVGIIGGNGAGKSTLLKILSRITTPTEGDACIQGRVGSLLEVGTGFHPDLTGRENVYANGVTLGLSHTEIAKRFDGIVNFADIERFIDTPIKHYSSGMSMRLAFAVASHLTVDVMILDEVLAVGDAAFQRKCLKRMQHITRQGNTVLFVSHSLPAIESFCSRCILLENGKVVIDGSPRDAIRIFTKQLGIVPKGPVKKLKFESEPDTPIQVTETELLAPYTGAQGEVVPMRVSYHVRRDVPAALFCIDVRTSSDISIYYANDESLQVDHKRHKGDHVIVCDIPIELFAPGEYQIRFGFWEPPLGVPYHFPDETLSLIRHDNPTKSGRLAGLGVSWPSLIYHDSNWAYRSNNDSAPNSQKAGKTK